MKGGGGAKQEFIALQTRLKRRGKIKQSDWEAVTTGVLKESLGKKKEDGASVTAESRTELSESTSVAVRAGCQNEYITAHTPTLRNAAANHNTMRRIRN